MSLEFIKNTPRSTLGAISAELGVMRYEVTGIQKKLASNDAKIVLDFVITQISFAEDLIQRVISGLDLTGWEELK